MLRVLLSLLQVNVSKDLIMLEVFDEHRLVSGVMVATYTSRCDERVKERERDRERERGINIQ